MVTRRTLLAGIGAGAAGLAFCRPSAAQERYPSRPIEFVVPWGAGGGADQTARKLAALLEPRLGVSLPVVNVPGGTGVTGLTRMLSAAPDGYTMAIVTADTTGLLAIAPQRWQFSDLAPLAMATQQRSGIFVREGGRFGSWEEIASEAKRRELKVAINGLGSPEELAVNFFRRQGFRFTAVPYQRPGERYAAVLGDHADLLYEQAGDIRSFIESGQLRPVLILGQRRSEELPDVPVGVEVGVDLVLDQYRAIMVRSSTDPERVRLLAEELRAATATPEYAQYLRELWADPSSYLGPEEATRYIQADIEALRRLV
jgi:tripartite-type tricarboxylate transporter receptor subunit TctC